MPTLKTDPHIIPMRKSDPQFEYPDGSNWHRHISLSSPVENDLLDRNDWFEMQYFCNKFAHKLSKDRNIEDLAKVASRAERLIKKQVPDFLNSKIHIIDWLETNWAFYKNI